MWGRGEKVCLSFLVGGLGDGRWLGEGGWVSMGDGLNFDSEREASRYGVLAMRSMEYGQPQPLPLTLPFLSPFILPVPDHEISIDGVLPLSSLLLALQLWQESSFCFVRRLVLRCQSRISIFDFRLFFGFSIRFRY